MAEKRRTFTMLEKATILAEAEMTGFSETSKRHDLSTGILFVWRKKYKGRLPKVDRDEISLRLAKAKERPAARAVTSAESRIGIPTDASELMLENQRLRRQVKTLWSVIEELRRSMVDDAE